MKCQNKHTELLSRSPTSVTAKTAVVLGVLMTLSSAGLANAVSHSSFLNAPPLSTGAFVESIPNSASVLPPLPLQSIKSRTVELENVMQPHPHVGSATNTSVKGDQRPPQRPISNSGPISRRKRDEREGEIGVKRRASNPSEAVPRATSQPQANIIFAGNDTKVMDTINKFHSGNNAHARRHHHRLARDRNAGHYLGLQSRQFSRRSYTLVDSHEGPTFFDGWDFFDQSDPTHGMITYVSAGDARSSGLAYVQGDGVAVMTVDTNSTLGSGAYRKSVRIATKKSYNKGLFVFDILRAPHGCAVWPAAWIVGPNWPNSGEIDVIEGVHESAYNQATVHSAPGCMLDTSKSLSGGLLLAAGVDASEVFTGTPLDANCDVNMSYNAGCGILDMDARSYGAGLNGSGGAVYATLWDDTGVRIWFFSRDSVPVDITAKTPDPSTWGSPMAYWAASSCASSFFSDMSVVFDIVLGGDWAGATFSEAGCPGSLADFVANPTNFANANWAVNSVRIYQ